MKKLWLTSAVLIMASSAVAQNNTQDGEFNRNNTNTNGVTRPDGVRPDGTRPDGTRSGDTTSRRDPVVRGAESVRTNDFAMARRWQKASDLIGKDVQNAQNEDLGNIRDIVVDANSGRVLYAVLEFGGFLGMGDKLFAIPMRSLTLTSDADHFVLNVDKDRLKNAQGFDKNNWPNFADEQWATTTHKFYDQQPYWRDTGATGNASRDRWYQRTTVWQKASDLMGKDVRNPSNEDLGEIDDLAIDPDSGRVLYGILQHRGRNFAIPWGALSLTQNAERFTLNVDKDRLTDAVSFTGDRWPNLTDERWATDIHTHYNVQPYWTDATNRDMNREPR